MHYKINDTTAYHAGALNTLGWELTVCNMLEPQESPCRRILKRNASYGLLLYDYLSRFIPLHSLRKVIETGGGYGYLMRDFLARNAALEAVMLDISPFLLARQRETLGDERVRFIEADIMNVSGEDLRCFELAVFNENMGDFPTLVDVPRDVVLSKTPLEDHLLEQVRILLQRYRIEPPGVGIFNFNFGAVKVLEKLCQAGVPYIFIGEHSCEATAPEPLQRRVNLRASGIPERISLKGHDEYTLRISDLEKIALSCNYRVIRGPFADFLEFDFNGKNGYIPQTGTGLADEHEIVVHFIGDLFQYEYLILIKERGQEAGRCRGQL